VGYDTITFLSDYGTADEFVGVCHSVIRAIAPDVAVIDLTHDIAPHDVRAGALCLARSVQYLCPGVVVAVVDPGVGTDRRAIAVEVGGGQSVLVGPDNGLLAPAVSLCGGADRVVALTDDRYRLPAAGSTFDGRDVFSPAAAHLCAGVDIAELGPPVDPATLRPALVPITRVEDEGLVAEVLWADRFGNLQLNVDPEEVDGWGDRIGIRSGSVVRTGVRVGSYAAIAAGQVGLVVDSYGLLSIAVDQDSAVALLGIDAGDEVILERFDDDATRDDAAREGASGGQPSSPGVDTAVHLGARR
jgi:S-adenosyl-L-methionine hydrolase (adenosine-forming)